MCKVLEVSRSGYYAWLGRKPSQRAEDKRERVGALGHRQAALALERHDGWLGKALEAKLTLRRKRAAEG